MRVFSTACVIALAPSAFAFTVHTPYPRGGVVYAAAATSPAKASESKSQPLNPDHDVLLRVARGEQAHRTPVWLMRQVKYMLQMTMKAWYPHA